MQVDFRTETQPESEYLMEMESITDYALPRFKNTIQEGEGLREEVEKSISIAPVGILPLYKNDGYLFLYEPTISETRIYQYNLTIYENNHEKRRGLKTFYIDTVKRSVVNTFENIKIDLVKRFRHLPNPATYLVESKFVLPLEETLLPIAKKKVVDVIF